MKPLNCRGPGAVLPRCFVPPKNSVIGIAAVALWLALTRAEAGPTAGSVADATGTNTPAVFIPPPAGTVASQGYHLFLLNCAHCHGTDARGDEGPDLHGLVKSDAHIATLIKNGKKGEMPRFSTKLSDPDISALIAFLRTLED
jgi:mono/diheme cytochrome c family protein